MTPEELFEHLSKNINRDLQTWASAAGKIVSAKTDEDKATQLVAAKPDFAETLAQSGLVSDEQVAKISALSTVIANSSSIRDYGEDAVKPLLADPKYVELSIKLGLDPASLNSEELEYLVEKTLAEDSLVSGAILVATSEPDVRKALGIPQDVTAEKFMLDLRRSIGDANTVSDVPLPELLCLGNSPVVAVVVLALAFVVAVSHVAVSNTAVLTIVALVFGVVSVAAEGSSSLGGLAEKTIAIENAENLVSNNTDLTLWLLIEVGGFLKKFPLPPKRESAEFGISSVLGIFVGGEGNKIDQLQANGGHVERRKGIYRIGPKSIDCSVVEVRESQQGVASCFSNEIQEQFESNESAFVVEELYFTKFERTFRFETLASVIPENFDFSALAKFYKARQSFDKTTQLWDTANGVTELMKKHVWGKNDDKC